MPAIKARKTCCFIGRRDGVVGESGMGSVFKHCGLDSLIIVDGAVADELHLRNTRDGLVIPMPV